MAKILAMKAGRDFVRLDKSGEQAISHLSIGETIEIDIPSASTGTIPMLRTWRMWMAQMAQHMAANGAVMPLWPMHPERGSRPFNADDAHESFTHLLLGCDENGQRYSWSMGSGKNQAPKDKRLYAMDKLVAMAFEKGVALKIPQNSEYSKLKQENENG